MKSGKKVIAIVAAAALLGTTAVPAFAAEKITKDETVYVVTEADGSQNEVTVSDHLINEPGSDQIKDKSNLKDIENVKGDETFETGDKDALTWKAGGNDIFYQGSTDKDVPVKLGISYFLNDEEVQGNELEGADGDVRIVIKYRNTATADNGTTVPFLAMTAFIAEDDSFTDIKIDHGKVIDDGDKQIVAAIAVPGLQDALNIDKDLVDLDLSDTVTITGTAKDFAIEDMMTVVTNSIFEEVDSDDFGDLDYDDQIRQLDKGAKALVDGSNQLYKGVDTLYENMPTLKKGVNKLAKGSDELSKGTDEAKQGAQALDKGAKQLSGSLSEQMTDAVTATSQLQAGATQVQQGIEQVKNGLDGDGTASNPGAANALNQTASGLSQGAGQLRSSAGDLQSAAQGAAALSQYMNEVAKAVNANKDILKVRYPELVAQTDNMQSIANSLSSKLSGVPGDLNNAADSIYSDSNPQSAGKIVESVSKGVSAASAGLGQTIEGQKQVVDGITQLHDTLAKATGEDGELTKGLTSLVNGTGQLKAGEVQLSGGAKQLANGMEKLQKSSGTLSSGVSKLDQGSLKLSKGMNELYSKGIKKIVDLYNDDLKGTMNDLEDVLDAGQSYTTFTEKPSGMDGSVKFIYKTTVY